MAAEYLFPFPAHVVRDGLNLRAQLGEPFTDDHAAADIMLDLDAVARGRSQARAGSDLPHAVRFYAERWGWPKSRVHAGLAGDARRGTPPHLRQKAADWRAFFADSGGQGADSGGQKPARKAPKRQVRGQGADSGGQGADRIEQTTDQQKRTTSSKKTRAPRAPGPIELPPGISPEVWADWEAHRREKRQPLTPTSIKQQLKDLATWTHAGHDPEDILRRSIANGWSGLFEPDRPAGRNGRAGGHSGSVPNARERANGLSARALAESAADSLALLRAGRGDGDDAARGGA